MLPSNCGKFYLLLAVFPAREESSVKLQITLMKVGTIVKTLVEESKKTEIYSVWNFDMKFDAKHALGARRTHESILVFAVDTLTQYILRQCQISHKLTSLVVDYFVTKMRPTAVSSKKNLLTHTGCCVSIIFPISRHEPHKLTFLVLDYVVANCENNKHGHSINKNVNRFWHHLNDPEI